MPLSKRSFVHSFRIILAWLGATACHSALAQPGWHSEPVYLWIWENENKEPRECRDRFVVTAEFYLMSDVSEIDRPMWTEQLQCVQDTARHMYHADAWETPMTKGEESMPAYYHSCRSAQGGEYLIHSITITRQDGATMKLKTHEFIPREYIYYNNSNSAEIPAMVLFRPGEYYFYELNYMGELQRIKEKYQQSTCAWHSPTPKARSDEHYLKKLKASGLSIGTGYVMVKVSTSQQTPVNNAVVTAHFDDDRVAQLTHVYSDHQSAVYLYTADPAGTSAAERIQKITVSALDYRGYAYFTEEIIPHSTLEEVTLFRVNEDFIYHSYFQRLPLHTDGHFLGVYFPREGKLDTTGFALRLRELELEVDTTFDYCGQYYGQSSNSWLLKKSNGSYFDSEHCQELGFLRKEFPQIAVSPKFYLRMQGNDGNRKDFFQLITNRVQVFYHIHQPAMTELFDELQLPYAHNERERYYELTLSLTSSLSEMNRISELLKASGLFTGVEHQYYPVWCLD